MNASPGGYLLSSDLIDASRIEGLATSLGLRMASCRTPADLLALATERAPSCVLVDLHQPGLDIARVVTALRAGGNPLVVGFGAHVAADVLQQARRAGCDLVQPRSQFFAQLAVNLPAWFAGRDRP